MGHACCHTVPGEDGSGSAYTSHLALAYDASLLGTRDSFLALASSPEGREAIRRSFNDHAIIPVLKYDDVAFLKSELDAALALLEDALSLMPEIRDIIEPYLSDPLNVDQVYEAFAQADRYWRQHSFKKGTASKFEDAMLLAVATGVARPGQNATVGADILQKIIEGMNRAAKYYTNNYFNRQVMPALYNSVEAALAGNTPKALSGFRFVQHTLTQRLTTVPYWNTVANAAASRAYHYGYVKAGMVLGYKTYVFQAVMDERTTVICSELHGQEWYLDMANDLMDRVAAAENPEDLKEITPWLNPKDLQSFDIAELAQLGVMIPPLHGRCRSTIILK